MAFLLAAPEAAEAAEGAAGAVRGARAAKAAKSAKGGRTPRKITPGMSPAETNAELQARGKDAAARKQARQDIANNPRVEPDDDPNAPQPGAAPKDKAAPLFQVQPMSKWHTGGGMALGAIGWCLFTNYMRGGLPQVRRWGAAKFLNKTPTVGATK